MGCARAVGIERLASGAPQWAERFQIGPEAAGPGKVAPGLEAAASLEVPAAESFTAYLRASTPIPPPSRYHTPMLPKHGGMEGAGTVPTGCDPQVYLFDHRSAPLPRTSERISPQTPSCLPSELHYPISH